MTPSTKSATEIDVAVAHRVRARRVAIGMSQEKLGDALGLTFQQVQKYEKGTNRIPSGRLTVIAEVLGCDVVDLYPPKSNDGPVGSGRTDTAAGRFAMSREFGRVAAVFDGVADPVRRGQLVDILKLAAGPAQGPVAA